MKLAKELAREARRRGICKEWYIMLKSLTSKQDMLDMYIRGIDFCLQHDYPGNSYIRANFKGKMENHGIFLDDNFSIINSRTCVALGSCRGEVRHSGYSVGQVFIRHTSSLELIATDDSFVMVDIFDGATLSITASGRAKVCVNRYGGTISTNTPPDGLATVKIVEKHKQTY